MEKLEKLLERMAADAAATRQVLERLEVQRFGDRTKTAPWGPIFGTATLAASASSVVVTLASPQSQAGVVLGWALSATDPGGAGGDAWASTPTATDGVVVDVLRGAQPVFDLCGINSPPAPIGDLRENLWLPFYPDQPLSVRARNLDAVNSVEVCVQLYGIWSDVFLGRRP